MKHNLETLVALRPCSGGLEFAKRHPTLAAAWEACERSDWMLWFLREAKLLDKPLAVRLAIAFAERVLPVFESRYPGKPEPRKALDAAKAWLAEPTEANRKSAADAAYAAAAYAAAAYAAYAADAAAAYAAYAADAAAAAAADAAAYAAAHAAYAADAAAHAAACAAQIEERAEQCRIIRSTVANPFLKPT